MITYNIELTYFDGSTEIIELTTDNLNRSMDLYQRNRKPVGWKVLWIMAQNEN